MTAAALHREAGPVTKTTTMSRAAGGADKTSASRNPECWSGSRLAKDGSFLFLRSLDL